MPSQSSSPRLESQWRFGVFEFTEQTLELRKAGRLVAVRPQPLKLLALLVGRPRQLVTRDDVQRALWDSDTFVDFEQGVNQAVRELRAALGDDADSPRFIETLPRRGYRFIAPVEVNGAVVAATAQPRDTAVGASWLGRHQAMARGLVIAAVTIAAVVAASRVTRRPADPAATVTATEMLAIRPFAVTATDKKGNIVSDLTRDDFEVIEDGKKQTAEYFAHGDGDAAPPMHVGLMIDFSGSMQNDLKLAQGAAIKFLNLLPAAEDITLVDFDTQVRITRYPQRDFARLVERIRQRKADGWTALYDALGTYLDGADSQDGRKVLVMYTDGGDSRSAITLSETLTLLQASNVTVYAIGLVENAGSARAQMQMTLRHAPSRVVLVEW